MAIVPLHEADLALLQRVAPEVFDAPLTTEAARAYLAQPGHRLVLAVIDGQVVGQASAVVHARPGKPNDLYIDEVGVSPNFQRRGLATRLVRHLLDWGRSRGCSEVWLATEPDNTAARGLYAALELEEETAALFSAKLG